MYEMLIQKVQVKYKSYKQLPIKRLDEYFLCQAVAGHSYGGGQL